MFNFIEKITGREIACMKSFLIFGLEIPYYIRFHKHTPFDSTCGDEDCKLCK